MEPNKRVGSNHEGLGGSSWANHMPNNEQKPFSMMPPSHLPLHPTGSYQWTKPYWMNRPPVHPAGGFGGGSSSSAGGGSGAINILAQLPPDTVANRANTTAITVVNDASGKNIASSDNEGDSTAVGSHDKKNTDIKIVMVDDIQVKLGKAINVETMDPKKLKRIISNRASAQKSRLKKLQHVVELEKKAKDLETQIAFLAPQVGFYTQKKYYLQMEQNALKERMAACSNDMIQKDAEIEANQKEVARLRQLQIDQHLHLQTKANATSRLMTREDARKMDQMANLQSMMLMEKMALGIQIQEKVGENSAELNKQKKQLNAPAAASKIKQEVHQPGKRGTGSSKDKLGPKEKGKKVDVKSEAGPNEMEEDAPNSNAGQKQKM